MGVGHGKSVDWWSLGILLYELCVGIPPFYSQNVHEMYHKIQHGVLRFPPFLSDACKSLIIGVSRVTTAIVLVVLVLLLLVLFSIGLSFSCVCVCVCVCLAARLGFATILSRFGVSRGRQSGEPTRLLSSISA